MPDSETMRSRFEAAIKRHHESEMWLGYCRGCKQEWPCPDFVANTRNLHDLNNAPFGFDIDHGWREDRLIPDPGMNPELRPDPLGGDHEH